MTRILKTLGLAVMATLALSAVTAATASAQTEGMIKANENVTLTGSEITEAGAPNAFTAYGGTIECTDHYTGHNTLTTAQTQAGSKHQLLTSGEKSVTVTPHYTNCNLPVDRKGCDYDFYDFTTVSAGTYSFKTDIVCPTGVAGIQIGTICPTTVPPQKGLTGAHATNEAGGHIRIKGVIKGITANNTCLGHTKTAELHTNVTIIGLNSIGKQIEVSISD